MAKCSGLCPVKQLMTLKVNGIIATHDLSVGKINLNTSR